MTGAAQRVPTGHYDLEASLNGQAFPGRLELLDVDGRPWGRLALQLGQEIVLAVDGIVRTEAGWRFAVGGPVLGMNLAFDDGVTGTLRLGSMPPVSLAGARTSDVTRAEDLRAQHVLEPLGLAERSGHAASSFPTTADGDLVFAAHGHDLAHPTLMRSRVTSGVSPAGEPTTSEAGRGGLAHVAWGDPETLSFSGVHGDRSPAFLPDGSALVFASDRPVDDDDQSGPYRLWIASADGRGGWSDPARVRFEGGWPHDARQPSVTDDGTLHFSSSADGGHGEGDIYRADPVAPGRWGAPRNLGPDVNGPLDEHGAFVAPDESYMILTSAGRRDGSRGGDDLFLLRRTDDGWTTPVALPLPVNTFANEYGAWVSSTGHLYFSSDRYGFARLFRVDAEVAALGGVLR